MAEEQGVLFLRDEDGEPRLALFDKDRIRGLLEETFEESDHNLRPVWEGDPGINRVEVLVTSMHELGKERLEGWPNLKMVSLAFTGYDQVAKEYCKKKGIAVYYVPGYATQSVAELTIGLTLSILRKMQRADASIRAGLWHASCAPGFELAKKTVGIVGTGTIGQQTARLFRAFGCSVLGWSRPKTRRSEFIALGGAYVSWEAIFAQSDIVVLHLAQNSKTKGIVGAKELSWLRDGAVLINTSRAGLVEEKALVRELQEGRIYAGLDVFHNEPVSASDPLPKLDNVVATPHLGFKTDVALERLARVTLKNIRRFLDRDPTNRII